MPQLNRRPQDIAVLVADDSRVVRVKTSRVLAKHQFRIVLAEDGQEAWRQIQAAPIDVLITAAGMPGLDGFELTRRVRANPLTAQMQVIMVTAADEQLRTRAADAGANLLLGKPYDDAVLIAHIVRSLNLSTATN